MRIAKSGFKVEQIRLCTSTNRFKCEVAGPSFILFTILAATAVDDDVVCKADGNSDLGLNSHHGSGTLAGPSLTGRAAASLPTLRYNFFLSHGQ
jgi:hypothetical protein